MVIWYCKDSKTKYNQKAETREINIGLTLVISGKLSETFTEFLTELKRKFELAKGTINIQYEE